MKYCKKRIVFIACLLCFICVFGLCMNNFIVSQSSIKQVKIRTVKIADANIDYQSVLNEFENPEMKTENYDTSFVGYQRMSLSDFNELNNLSDTNLENEEVVIKYQFNYNSQTNLITLSATMNNDGEIIVDEIVGSAFINQKGNIDAVMNVDGEAILLSEMQDKGLINNCGWFSRLIRKVAVAVAVVAVSVAVVAVVVATVGAAAPAVVAAGVGITTSAVATAVASATTLACTSLTVAMVAAGVMVATEIAELTWDNVTYKLESFEKVKHLLQGGFYYLAIATSDGGMLVSPIRLPSVIVAAAAFNAGLSVYSPDAAEAYCVATQAGGGIPAITEGKPHKSGYFMHYHRWDHNPKNAHAFYGLPIFY